MACNTLQSGNWRHAHEELSRLARVRAGLDAEEGRSMLRAERCRVHAELGYGSFAEYIERLFGYDAQTTREKLRVAAALEELPALYQGLSNGDVSWSAVRELTHVATADTETEWLAAARGKTVRQVEKQVAGRQRGARPGDLADPKAERHVLRFDVSAETLATFREAMDKLRRDAGSSLDDDAALLLMARHVLGGPTDEGRASYQVLVNVCEQCGRGELRRAAHPDVPRGTRHGNFPRGTRKQEDGERPSARPETPPRDARHPAGRPPRSDAPRWGMLRRAWLQEQGVRRRAPSLLALRGRRPRPG